MKTTKARSFRTERVVQVGFDVLDILTARFEKEMGRAFYRSWNEGLAGMEGLPGSLFEGIQPGAENREINAHIVRTRWEDLGDPTDPRPLLEAFLALIGVQLEAAQRVIGVQIVQRAAGEAVRVLSVVDRYEEDTEAARAFMDRLRALPR
jgi:hypothetical protein